MDGSDTFFEYLSLSDSDRILKENAQRLLGINYFEHLVSCGALVKFILEETTCPNCHQETVEVVYDKNDRGEDEFSGYCPSKECGLRYFKEDQITAYNVRFIKLIEIIANELGLVGSKGKVADLRLWHLGNGGDKKISYSIYLLLQEPTPETANALNNLADGEINQVVVVPPSYLTLKPQNLPSKFVTPSSLQDASGTVYTPHHIKKLFTDKVVGLKIDTKNYCLTLNDETVVKFARHTNGFKMLTLLWNAGGTIVPYTEIYRGIIGKPAHIPKIASDKCQRWKSDLVANGRTHKREDVVDKIIIADQLKSGQYGYRLNSNFK